jgi:EAL domain-containing protein (putative c-di-GMP-specific phosphodiesterase class I)/GGDEF domain-containing protein
MQTGSLAADRGREKALALRKVIETQRVTPLFQPVVEGERRELLGYEVLSRGVYPMEDPREMLRVARLTEMLPELERAFRQAALLRIASMPEELRRSTTFFLNATPETVASRELERALSPDSLARFGLDPSSIAVELTGGRIPDRRALTDGLEALRIMGLRISVDEVGDRRDLEEIDLEYGPDFIKLGLGLTHEITAYSRSRQTVRSVLAWARMRDAAVVGKGVETREQLEVLAELGVTCFQGHMAGRPETSAREVEDDFWFTSMEVLRTLMGREKDSEAVVSSICVMPATVESGRVTCEELDGMFQHQPDLGHVVVVEEGRPLGVITRQHFYLSTGGRFGYSVFQLKPVNEVMKPEPLIFGDGARIVELAREAMGRSREDMYDPVVVVDRGGMLAGSVTIKQLLDRATELESRTSRGLSPLTGLPGAIPLGRRIEEILDIGSYTYILFDLTSFRAYNIAYGFDSGDEMLRMTAEILRQNTELVAPDAFLAHEGGDRFVIITIRPVRDEVLDKLCALFEQRRGEMFCLEDRNRGCFLIRSRSGQELQVPLVSLSVSVVTDGNFASRPHPVQLREAANSLRKKLRREGGAAGKSTFLRERRVFKGSGE